MGKVEDIKGANLVGEVKAVCISKEKGSKKQNIDKATFKENFGIIYDAHAGSSRQVSLLAEESIKKMQAKGLKVNYGDFAENIVTKGVDLKNLPISTKIKIGEKVILRVTQIGKECHSRCAIYYQAGDCVMPKEGIFAKVENGGIVRTGDKIDILKI